MSRKFGVVETRKSKLEEFVDLNHRNIVLLVIMIARIVLLEHRSSRIQPVQYQYQYQLNTNFNTNLQRSYWFKLKPRLINKKRHQIIGIVQSLFNYWKYKMKKTILPLFLMISWFVMTEKETLCNAEISHSLNKLFS